MPSWESIRAAVAGSLLLQSAVIVLASLLVAWLADRLFTRVVARWVRRTSTDLDDRILAALHGPVRTSVVLVGLAVVTVHVEAAGDGGAAGPTWIALVRSALATVAILVWTGAGLRLCGPLFTAAERRFGFVEARTLPLFTNLARVVLVGGAVYFVFVSWGIDVTAWMASAGIIGIAVGFAAKDTLANLFAGIFISADAPYKLGDYINLDTGERGMVTHVGIRSTRILTRDDIEITLPNSIIANAKVINESSGRWEKERLRVKVSAAYGSDIDAVRRELLAAVPEVEAVCPQPEPRVRFRAFGESGLELELLCWIDEPVLRGRVIDALNTRIYKRFAAAGIEIPYPKRDVYVRAMPGAEPPGS